MGIKDVRDAFIAAGNGKLRCRTCELHTVPDGNNSQRLLIEGEMEGKPFSYDSGPFDPKMPPALKAQAMAKEVLAGTMGFQRPPHPAAAQHHRQ